MKLISMIDFVLGQVHKMEDKENQMVHTCFVAGIVADRLSEVLGKISPNVLHLNDSFLTD